MFPYNSADSVRSNFSSRRIRYAATVSSILELAFNNISWTVSTTGTRASRLALPRTLWLRGALQIFHLFQPPRGSATQRKPTALHHQRTRPCTRLTRANTQGTHLFFTFWLARNVRVHTSTRSIGFCIIWVCISSSSTSSIFTTTVGNFWYSNGVKQQRYPYILCTGQNFSKNLEWTLVSSASSQENF